MVMNHRIRSCFLVFAFSLAGLLTRAGFGAERPNIVFIMTDDHAAYAVSGSARLPGIQSPGFDRLKAEGTAFRNAFVTTSLCSPSRATALTGLYAHRSGVPINQSRQDPDESVPLVSELLQKEGYTTAFIGKWHMKDTDTPRRGFDYWYAFEGQGRYNDPVMNENGTRSEVPGYTTDILTDRAVEWMREHGDEGPFCLFLWHKAPHGPFEPAERHRDLYDDLPIPAPPNWGDTFVDKPAHYRRAAEWGNVHKFWKGSEGKPIPDSVPPKRPWVSQGRDGRLEMIRSYLECQQAVDEGLERILDALDETGLANETLVIYTSDNGMNLFAHHFTYDKRTAWEESIRVPLVMRWPGQVPSGAEREEFALNVDFVPTFLELAGAEPPEYLQGRSLVPLLRGESVPAWRDSMLYLYFAERFAPGFPTVLAVRDERYKYIHLPEDEEDFDELYDLQTDPYELKNLFGDPAYAEVRERMRARLREHLREAGYDEAAPQLGYAP